MIHKVYAGNCKKSKYVMENLQNHEKTDKFDLKHFNTSCSVIDKEANKFIEHQKSK